MVSRHSPVGRTLGVAAAVSVSVIAVVRFLTRP